MLSLKLIIRAGAVVIALISPLSYSTARAQGLLKQLNDSQQPQAMTNAELSNLGDPFFLLVLRNNSQVTSRKGIETLIQPNAPRDDLTKHWSISIRLESGTICKTRRRAMQN